MSRARDLQRGTAAVALSAKADSSDSEDESDDDIMCFDPSSSQPQTTQESPVGAHSTAARRAARGARKPDRAPAAARSDHGGAGGANAEVVDHGSSEHAPGEPDSPGGGTPDSSGEGAAGAAASPPAATTFAAQREQQKQKEESHRDTIKLMGDNPRIVWAGVGTKWPCIVIPSKSTSYIFERDLEAEEYLDITGKRKFLCEYIDPRRRRFLTRQVQVFSQADMVDFVPDDDNFKKLARKRPNRRGFDGCVAEAVRLHAVLQEVLEERREQLATMKPSIDASASSALELSMPLGEQPASSRARSNRKRPTAAQRKAARGLSKPGQLRAGDLIAFYRPGPVHHTADNLLEQRILQIRKSILPVRLQSGIDLPKDHPVQNLEGERATRQPFPINSYKLKLGKVAGLDDATANALELRDGMRKIAKQFPDIADISVLAPARRTSPRKRGREQNKRSPPRGAAAVASGAGATDGSRARGGAGADAAATGATSSSDSDSDDSDSDGGDVAVALPSSVEPPSRSQAASRAPNVAPVFASVKAAASGANTARKAVKRRRRR